MNISQSRQVISFICIRYFEIKYFAHVHTADSWNTVKIFHIFPFPLLYPPCHVLYHKPLNYPQYPAIDSLLETQNSKIRSALNACLNSHLDFKKKKKRITFPHLQLKFILFCPIIIGNQVHLTNTKRRFNTFVT